MVETAYNRLTSQSEKEVEKIMGLRVIVWVFSSPLWKRGARGDFINHRQLHIFLRTPFQLLFIRKHLFLKSPYIPLFQRGINIKVYLTPKQNLPTHFHDEPK
jgi:hypothetical protein